MTFLLHKVVGIVSIGLVATTVAFAEPCLKEPAPKDIIDAATCAASTPMTLSGPAAWSAGATWTASGGVGPYAYSAGFPLVSGTSTDFARCGTSTITATDRCGNSASIQVQAANSWPDPELMTQDQRNAIAVGDSLLSPYGPMIVVYKGWEGMCCYAGESAWENQGHNYWWNAGFEGSLAFGFLITLVETTPFPSSCTP